MLTLIRSSFSSLDSRGLLSPHHSTLVRLPHYGANCSLPQLFRGLFPFHLVSYTHNTPTFLVSIISAKLPSSSRHRPNIKTAHSHAVTVQIPDKKRHLARSKSQFTIWPRFHRLQYAQKLPKIVYGDSIKKMRKSNDWLDYWSGRKTSSKKKKYRLDYWSGHGRTKDFELIYYFDIYGRTNRTVCYGPVLTAAEIDRIVDRRITKLQFKKTNCLV